LKENLLANQNSQKMLEMMSNAANQLVRCVIKKQLNATSKTQIRFDKCIAI